MKRRRFVQALAIAPAAPALLAQRGQPAPAPAPAPAAAAPPRAGGTASAEEIKLEIASPDSVADPDQRFFNPAQFAALQRLSDLLMPPMRGNPGALDTGAPEFLDFLVGVSPADRQLLYRNGLDGLNAHAKKQFAKPFADLDNTQADAVIRPLLVAVPWYYDPPKDPLQHFLATAHDQIRTATRNSREYNTSNGRRGSGGTFWTPVDPVYKG